MRHIIKTTFGETVTFSGTKEEAEKVEKKLNARGEFAKKYMEKKGWSIENLSVDQLLEIRNQEEWKNAQ